ncbi:MAG TPA: class I tRNA ligase family protein, partial [Acidimicrobiales bacterium]|nr:class I tRNA ligase family protein [Acidimicrobiales bacterium]
RPLVGTRVLSPLFRAPVPVLAHALADPDKGTGIAMVCTFGDLTDVVWWRELGLPVRAVMGRDGRIEPAPWGEPGWETEDAESARRHHRLLAGLTAEQARRRVAELLASSGDLVGDPRPITHPVKYYERGERPLEIVTSRQWFVRTLDLRDRLIELGRQLEWHPPHMRARYESWVEGLNSDWNVSRQRYFGVPFPVWYPLDDQGTPCWSSPIVAPEEALPVDPSTDAPPSYDESQRGQPGGFVGDPDVMDTWATSSLTPLIASGWEDDPDLFSRVYPMDLRPQGHDIIRTWLFTTVLRSELEHGRLPWSHAMINGWVLDPDRKKMSKSKGNVVTPMDHVRAYGADAVRYWASSGRPGVDTAFDEGQLRVGRRLAIKILNASRFVISRLAGADGEAVAPPAPGQVSFPLDAALLARLAATVDEATAAMEAYDYARALERAESFFWSFCDDYVELVKGRAYGTEGEAGAASAKACLELALSALLRLFAPHLPFVTEEVWSWWQDGSIHRAGWPSGAELRMAGGGDGDPAVLEVAAEVLSRVRRAKTEAKLSMRAPVARLEVVDTPERIEALKAAQSELAEAGVLQSAPALVVGGAPSVVVELAQPA